MSLYAGGVGVCAIACVCISDDNESFLFTLCSLEVKIMSPDMVHMYLPTQSYFQPKMNKGLREKVHKGFSQPSANTIFPNVCSIIV